MRRAASAAISVVLLLLVVAPAALAQQPYPPPPPPDGGDPVAVAVFVEVGADGVFRCQGSGWMPGSNPTVELRHVADAGRTAAAADDDARAGDLIATTQASVDADGNLNCEVTIPCPFDATELYVRITGVDENGVATSQSDIVPVAPITRCAIDGGDGGGTTLPRTGLNILILLAVALALIAGGTALARKRGEA